MSTIEFKLQDLGEGIESGAVVRLMVAEGDVIAAGQTVLEMEVDKAAVELPCPHAGKITALAIAVGDTVPVGALLFSVDTSAAGEAPTVVAAESGDEAAVAASATSGGEAAVAASAAAASATGSAGGSATAVATAGLAQRTAPSPGTTPGGRRVYPAGPAVRRLARLLGVALGQISGTGERGRITAQDVHAFVARLRASAASATPSAAPALPDFSRWGPVEVLPLSTVRKRTAEVMARSWNLIPHVTHHDKADITDLEAGRKAFRKANPTWPKVTMTVLVAKACAVALKAFPDVNSSLDLARGAQIFKHHYHLGIAVDTDYGLVVPVLRDVDKKPILELAAELTDLAGRARDRKLKAQEMHGATFTISNLGGIGGTGFTPIVNWPQVAILGVSRGRQEYQVTAAGPRPRLQMPLSLSYDHRLVDGAQAARFVKYLVGLLANPNQLLFTI